MIVAGFLGGHYPQRKGQLLSLLYLLRAVLFGLMDVLPASEYVVLSFAGCLGLLYLSTVPLTAGLVVDIVGPAYNSTLFGERNGPLSTDTNLN